MRKLIVTIATAFLLMGISGQQADAGGPNRRVGRTERHQMRRINQGVRSGELTREEAKDLRQEQRHINQMRKEAKRDDGKIDQHELKDIRSEQKDASKNIYDQKHDSEQRGQ